MTKLQSIDNTLMKIFTVNFRYRKYEDRPQLTLAILSTAIFLLLLFFVQANIVMIPCVVLYLIISFYEWRLWYKLQKDGIYHPVTEGVSIISPFIYLVYRIKGKF